MKAFFSPFPVLVLALLLLLGTGCQRTASLPSVQTFVGPVESSDAFIALAIVDGEIMAYVCDGRDTATWLRGAASGDDLILTSDGARLRAQRTDEGLTGTLTLEQRSHPFTVTPATGSAGFYRATETIAGVGYVGGWILLSNGLQRGALKRDGQIVATDALDPHHPTVSLSGGGTLEARPAEAFLAPGNPVASR